MKKESGKVTLSMFLLVLSIIAIVALGVYTYKIYNEKSEVSKKSSDLQDQINSLNQTVTELEGKLNSSPEPVTSFTDEQVKTALTNFLGLYSASQCDNVLYELTDKGVLDYAYSKNKELGDGRIITNVKFSDYKNAMLNYVSESEFEKNWTSSIFYKENSDGYLVKSEGGGACAFYAVNSITKVDDSSYSAKCTARVDSESTLTDVTFTFKIKPYNNKCVIDTFVEKNRPN